MTTTSATNRTGSVLARIRYWLALAASPAFGLMAWVTAGDAAALCSPGSGVLPIGDMATMYLLMSLFHLPAWLCLGAGRQRIHNQPIITGD